MGKYIKYKHHTDEEVSVREDLKGKHREYCLCHSCDNFFPGSENNCYIAQELYQLDIKHNLVTPVFECPRFLNVGINDID